MLFVVSNIRHVVSLEYQVMEYDLMTYKSRLGCLFPSQSIRH